MNAATIRSTMLSFVMGMVGATAAMGFAGSGSAGAQTAHVISDQVTVVGDDANNRILLTGGPGPRSAVQLLDTTGHNRIGVEMGGPGGTEPNAYGFHLRTVDGTILGNFGMARNTAGQLDGGVTMALSDQKGRPRVVMLVAGDGTPSLQLLDDAGNVTWSAP